MLGQHSEEILRELGYSEESIVALIREGVTQIAVSPK
jgi:crotonobetainyl-CoA:carnitine CoA-transferase CaiB-like acyl-CoA transferase